jgi:hypothetical protein
MRNPQGVSRIAFRQPVGSVGALICIPVLPRTAGEEASICCYTTAPALTGVSSILRPAAMRQQKFGGDYSIFGGPEVEQARQCRIIQQWLDY